MADPTETLNERLTELTAAVKEAARATEELARTFQARDPVAVNLSQIHQTLKDLVARIK